MFIELKKITKLRLYFIMIVSLLFIQVACKSSRENEIQVAVAANLKSVVEKLKSDFKKNNDQIKLKIIIGSSGRITSQIINGAPYDIFLAANMEYPEKLYQVGKSISKPKVYASGSLIFFTKNNTSIQNWKIIFKDELNKHIAIANPNVAPYGKAAAEVINNLKYNDVKKKLVIGQNVMQTASIVLNAADCGFISQSILYTEEFKKYNIENKNWFLINRSLYSPLKQGVVMINKNKKILKFYNFLFSNEAKKIFKKYGYII